MEGDGKNIMAEILLITLSHNRKPLIGHAIRSVLSQTLPSNKFNYLIFDNNSTDGAKKVIHAAIKKYSNIHAHFHPTNLGQQPAYNQILYDIIPKRFPKTEVIGILDDDDMLYPKALVKVSNFYDAHKNDNLGGTYSGFDIVNDYGVVIHHNHAKAKLVENQFTPQGQAILRKIFIASNPCGHMRCYSVDALRNIGGFITDKSFATDYAIFGKLLEKYKVAKIDSVIYAFRQHGFGQIERKHSPQQTQDWKYYQQYFKTRFKQLGLI